MRKERGLIKNVMQLQNTFSKIPQNGMVTVLLLVGSRKAKSNPMANKI